MILNAIIKFVQQNKVGLVLHIIYSIHGLTQKYHIVLFYYDHELKCVCQSLELSVCYHRDFAMFCRQILKQLVVTSKQMH